MPDKPTFPVPETEPSGEGNARVLCLLLLALFAAGWMVRIFVEKWAFQEDFRIAYVAVQTATSAGNPYRARDLQAVSSLPVSEAFAKPPLVLALYRPFGLWPPNPAYEFWFVLNLALTVLLVRHWSNRFGTLGLTVPAALLLTLGFDTALLGELSSGGTCLLEQVLVAAALLALSRRRAWLFCLGLLGAACLKPWLMLLSPLLLLTLGWRAGALSFAGCWGAFAGFAAANVWLHPDWSALYFGLVRVVEAGHGERSLLSAACGLSRWVLPGHESLAFSLGALAFLALAISAVALAARRWTAMVEGWGSARLEGLTSFACLTWALLSPRLAPGDFILCTVPALVIANDAWPSKPRFAVWALLLFPASWAATWGLGPVGTLLQFSPLAAVAVLWTGFIKGWPVSDALESRTLTAQRPAPITPPDGTEQETSSGVCRSLSRLDLAVLLSLLVLWNGVGENLGINWFDEGVTAYSSELVMEGQLPYRDFYTPYGPGMFLVVALGFKLFGPSLMLLKVLSVLTECALALSVFWLARQVAPAGLAALAGLFVCTWMEPYSGIPNPVAVVFALLGSAAFLPALTGRGQPRVFLAGVLLGISLLLRHDVALPVLLSHAVVGSCFWFVRDDLGPLSPGERLRRLGRDGARHAAGVLAAVAGPLVWLLGQVPFRMMYEQLVLIPLTIYPVNRRLPYPWGLPKSGALLETDLFLPRYLPKLSGWFQFIFPFLVVGLACWALLLLGRRREFRRGPAMPWAGLLFVLHAVLLFNQMAIRPDHWHLLPSMTACALLLVFSISVLARLGRPGPVLLLWLMLALVSVAPVAKRLELFRDWWCADRWVSLDTPRSQGIRIMSGVAPQYNSLIQYLREHVPEGRRIYVGNTWHDRILQCDPMTYFLSERHSATREFHMIPGVTTRDDVQRAIILDLERESVEYIVLFADKGWEPNASCRSSGVFTLDRWIRSNFVLVKDYYPWTVWRRSLAPIGLGAR